MRYPATPMTRALATLLSASIFCAPSTAAPTRLVISAESVRALSDADLLQTYESTAVAVGATDAPASSPNPPDYDEKCLLIKAEILHRGSAIVPLLAAALKTEVALKRRATPGHFTPGLVTDELKLLTQIGDPQAVGPLLDIVQMQNASNDQHGEPWDPRIKALSAIEKLTFVCFHKVRPHWGNFSDAVQHPGALDVDHFSPAELTKAVQLYRDWLAGEGKDPAQWLPLGRKHARAFLEGDDLDDAYCGAAFLTQPFNADPAPRNRDDMPDRTLHRLARILGDARPVPGGKKYEYQYQGKPLPISLFNWLSFMTAYGPRDRPYASILIRFQRDTGLNNWGGLQEMAKVGGPEIMAYYFGVLPAIDAEADATRNDPATSKPFSPGDLRGSWLDAQQICRAGIDRWAGQRFDGDVARIAWWKANEAKSPEQWLRNSLGVTAARADSGDKYETRLFRQLIPDAPYGTDERCPIAVRLGVPGTTVLPFRRKWFELHQFEFVYHPDTGTFRFPNAPSH